MEYLSPQGVFLRKVRPPHACGSSCGALLLGRRPPPGLCAGSPVTSCCLKLGRRLPWFPMQPGRAPTSGHGVPLLLLAWRVGLVVPVRPTLGMWFVVLCPAAALGAYTRAVSGASGRLFTGACIPCVLCPVFVATLRLFTSVRAVRGTCVMLVASFGSPLYLSCCIFVRCCLLDPFFFFFLL